VFIASTAHRSCLCCCLCSCLISSANNDRHEKNVRFLFVGGYLQKKAHSKQGDGFFYEGMGSKIRKNRWGCILPNQLKSKNRAFLVDLALSN
jgi:hypothetical protein